MQRARKTPCPKCGLLRHPPDGCPRRAANTRKVAGVDSESIGEKSVMFVAADETRRFVSTVEDVNGLDAERILAWFVGLPDTLLYVAFAFDYDVAQICRMLPPAHIAQLARSGRVYYRGFRLQYIRSKTFRVTDCATGKSITVWDVFGWLVCSFAKVCSDWKLGSESERALIVRMKAQRAEFEDSSFDAIRSYSILECQLLAQWMRINLSLHQSQNIPLRSFCGAGSTAAALLRQHRFKPPAIPPDVEAAAESAFYGGRSEISRIGAHTGEVFGYDINSAYPAAIRNLPELTDAIWTHQGRFTADSFGVWRVSWDCPANTVWGPFPVRGAPLPTGRRSVSLLYPISGAGWYHTVEVSAALACYPGMVTVHEGFTATVTGPPPFAWVNELAAERLRLKHAGDPAAYPLKVGLNSLYGKLAQHTGSRPFTSIMLAGAVTANCRSMLLPHMVKHRHKILLVATDGILSTCPLDVPVSNALGDWEFTLYDSAWILQAGVYWVGDKQRSRGVDARSITLDEVKRVWAEQGTEGILTVNTRRVLSPGQATAWNRPQDCGKWEAVTRSVRFSPTPRRSPFRRRKDVLLTKPATIDSFKLQAIFDGLFLEHTEDDIIIQELMD